jgi:hypothetical protein
MTRVVPFAFLLGLLLVATVSARTLAGVELPDTVVVDGTTLGLNGMGLREATFMRIKAYVAGLYLEKPTKDPDLVIDSRQPKRVTMKFLRTIDRESLASNWADALRKAGGKSMEPAIAQFTSLIDDVAPGDSLSFTWRPGGGIEIAKNDAVRGTIAGDEFARALFSLWFGREPGDPNLKTGMLGK